MTVETLFQRDRAVVVGALIVLAALSWAYILALPVQMDDAMAAMHTGTMSAETGWAPRDFVFTFGMWAVMMAGMKSVLLPRAHGYRNTACQMS